MSKSIEQLLTVLDKEYEIYLKFLNIAKEKRQIIIKGKIKELEEITKKEQAMILSLGKLENIREAIVRNIISELNIENVKNMTELAQYLDDKNKGNVLNAREKLSKLLEDVKRENDLNNKLIKQSLEYIEFNKNLLFSIDNKGSIYGARANEREIKTKTNLFDAKV